MKQAHQARKDEIVRDIDEATEPSAMTQEEALEFIEELTADLEARADGLRADIKGGG